MHCKKRWAEAQQIYFRGRENVRTKPVPFGQKYRPGTRVKIAKDLGLHMRHFKSGVNATVLYTYAHAYGGDNVKKYCLDVDGCGEVAWYEEWQLSPLTRKQQ